MSAALLHQKRTAIEHPPARARLRGQVGPAFDSAVPVARRCRAGL